jgi:hypothetical protein
MSSTAFADAHQEISFLVKSTQVSTAEVSAALVCSPSSSAMTVSPATGVNASVRLDLARKTPAPPRVTTPIVMELQTEAAPASTGKPSHAVPIPIPAFVGEAQAHAQTASSGNVREQFFRRPEIPAPRRAMIQIATASPMKDAHASTVKRKHVDRRRTRESVSAERVAASTVRMGNAKGRSFKHLETAPRHKITIATDVLTTLSTIPARAPSARRRSVESIRASMATGNASPASADVLERLATHRARLELVLVQLAPPRRTRVQLKATMPTAMVPRMTAASALWARAMAPAATIRAIRVAMVRDNACLAKQTQIAR